MLLRLAHLGITNVFAALRLLPGSDWDKDTEILILRHQLAVLHRELGGADAENLVRAAFGGVFEFVEAEEAARVRRFTRRRSRAPGPGSGIGMTVRSMDPAPPWHDLNPTVRAYLNHYQRRTVKPSMYGRRRSRSSIQMSTY